MIGKGEDIEEGTIGGVSRNTSSGRRRLRTRRRGELLLFERIGSPGDVAMSRGNTENSAKTALFPQTEGLFAYRGEEGDVAIERPSEAGTGPGSVRGASLRRKGVPSARRRLRRRRAIRIMPTRGAEHRLIAACDTPGPACFSACPWVEAPALSKVRTSCSSTSGIATSCKRGAGKAAPPRETL